MAKRIVISPCSLKFEVLPSILPYVIKMNSEQDFGQFIYEHQHMQVFYNIRAVN